VTHDVPLLSVTVAVTPISVSRVTFLTMAPFVPRQNAFAVFGVTCRLSTRSSPEYLTLRPTKRPALGLLGDKHTSRQSIRPAGRGTRSITCGIPVCVSNVLKTNNTRAQTVRQGRNPVTHCNTLQRTATHCDTLRHTATHCDTTKATRRLQHTATHCNTLQHTATHCNTLLHN